jgi:hypothetical protein
VCATALERLDFLFDTLLAFGLVPVSHVLVYAYVVNILFRKGGWLLFVSSGF